MKVFIGFVTVLQRDSLSSVQFSSVQSSRSVMSDSLRPHESQHARPPCPSPTPGVYSNSCLSSQWCHPAITSSVALFSSCPSNPSKHQGLFQWVSSLHEVAKVLEFQLQHQSFQWTPRTDLLQDGLVGSPCSPRDSQPSSPTPQFKSISFPALGSLLRAGWILSVLLIILCQSVANATFSAKNSGALNTHVCFFIPIKKLSRSVNLDKSLSCSDFSLQTYKARKHLHGTEILFLLL